MVAKRHKITNVPQFLKQRDINSYCIRVTFIVCYRVAQRKVGRLKAS